MKKLKYKSIEIEKTVVEAKPRRIKARWYLTDDGEQFIIRKGKSKKQKNIENYDRAMKGI